MIVFQLKYANNRTFNSKVYKKACTHLNGRCRVPVIEHLCSGMATRGRNEAILGTAVPNRIFVGGISNKISEEDLKDLFCNYGCVKATNIILDRSGAPKGYGFVTFETEEEAKRVLRDRDVNCCFMIKEKKLNISEAFKKHAFNRNKESALMHGAPIVWSASPYSGSVGIPNREFNYQQATWPYVWPQQYYMPCQYPYSQLPQYVCNNPTPQEYHYSTSGHTGNSDYCETSSADSGESLKHRGSPSRGAEYERTSTPLKTCPESNVYLQRSAESPSNYIPQMHHVLAKTVNGVVMAYPAPFLMAAPTVVRMKDGGDSESLYDIGYANSQMASSALTPPPTPMDNVTCDFNANTSMKCSRKN